MRLLIVTPEFPPHAGGGILKFYALFADSLAQAGVQVSVLVATPFSAFDDYVTKAGVQVRFVPLADVNRHARALSHLSAAPTYRRYIAAGLAARDVVRSVVDSVDVLETTDFGLLFAPLVAMADRPPVLVRMHGSLGQISEHEPVEHRAALDFALARLTEAMLLPAADSLVAYSPANAAEWTARLGTTVTFAPPPLNVTEPAAAITSHFSGVVAGRVQAWKGPQVLCDAIASLGTAVPADLRIAWAGRDTTTAPGGGSLSHWLAQKYPQVWGRHVLPVGQKPQDEIALMQASARYVVVPSMWDTFNYTLAESMAAGCVTLGSTGAGASYLLAAGQNGFTFKPGDATELARQLVRAHELSDADRRRIGGAARETVATELNPASIADQQRQHFASLSRRLGATPPTPWVRGFISHSADASEDAFLDNLSIRTLSKHLRRRLMRRLFAGA